MTFFEPRLLRARATPLAAPPYPSDRRKRAFDLVVAAGLLAVSLPLLALLMLAVALSSRGPVLYRSERHGCDGTRFHAIKLRTMVDLDRQRERLAAAGASTAARLERDFKLADDPRVTRVGRFLRRTSLDELPQLLNVLKGEMSMVGPRPKLLDEAHHYGDAFREIMSVRPGLTGHWQTAGRSDLPFEARVSLDLDYVRGRSLRWDTKICLITAIQLLSPRRHGAY